jgi:hypothetical protein
VILHNYNNVLNRLQRSADGWLILAEIPSCPPPPGCGSHRLFPMVLAGRSLGRRPSTAAEQAKKPGEDVEMDPQVFIDAARYAHIIAVAIGFGAAFLADYHVVSRLGRPIDDNLTTTLHLCHSVIWAMVAGMWVTGLILIHIRTGFDPASFTPKLIAKVITVAILTGNAMLISKIAVPLVEENRGRSLAANSASRASVPFPRQAGCWPLRWDPARFWRAATGSCSPS